MRWISSLREVGARTRGCERGINTPMPELPEVETIKEHLRELVLGSLITQVEVLDLGLVEQPSAEEFERGLEGERISGVRRRAKHLIVELDSGDSLVFQLKIGGQLLLVPPVEEPQTALMLVLHLDADRRLFLRDETRFTRARLLNAEELEARLAPLGPEPLEGEFRVNGAEYLRNTLSGEEWGRLHAAILKNLAAGVEHRGTTVRLYKDVLNHPGEHQSYLRVFEKHGKPCPGCEGKVVREKVGGRPTHFCPSCQREDWRDGEQELTLGQA